MSNGDLGWIGGNPEFKRWLADTCSG